jgi:hypothetical protein
VSVQADPAMRAKLAHLLTTPWTDKDEDPTDDLMQYEGLDGKTFATGFGFATGMYAGAELAADAFRYGVLRDRGGSCTDVARARKMVTVGMQSLHIASAITGKPGSIARAIARKDFPGDGPSATVVPLLAPNGSPLPAEKDNGTWRADNSVGAKYPNYVWVDSCSRDMLFGWTLAMASVWEVIKTDPTFDKALKDELQADAKAILTALMTVRSNGKDLELWDPDGRRTFHGNMHETSVDREYVLKNGVASMMALGEIAALASVVDDAPAKQYLATLTGARGLPSATTQTMQVVALGGDESNHSAFNMLFMTAWMARRYIPDASVRTTLRDPVEKQLYSPLFGDAKPKEWKQSFFDLIVAASSGQSWSGNNASNGSMDKAAVARGLDTLNAFADAPYYANAKNNCDNNEIAAKVCMLNDGATVVNLSLVKGKWLADKPIPMAHRPPSNFFWRSNPFIVNSEGDGPNNIMPGSDIRIAYWLGRYVRVD